MSTILTNKTLGFANTTSAVSGLTLRWASPELLEDDVRHSRESDIWAFGCVCYEVCPAILSDVDADTVFSGPHAIITISGIVGSPNSLEVVSGPSTSSARQRYFGSS